MITNIINISTASPEGDVSSVNGQTGDVVLTKASIGLGNVDNTSDADKPISVATQAALNNTVQLSGDQTIAGEKTFNNNVVMSADAQVLLGVSTSVNGIVLGVNGDPSLGMTVIDGGRTPDGLGFVADNNLVLSVHGAQVLINSPVVLRSYDVSTLPAVANNGGVAYCSDGDAGSPCLAVKSPTGWKVVSLGAAPSTT